MPNNTALQDFMLPALLYLTVRNPPWYVWVLNISIAVVYFAVAVLGSVGAVRFIVLVRPCSSCRAPSHVSAMVSRWRCPHTKRKRCLS